MGEAERRARLGRDDWIRAALDALAHGGMHELSIGRLAKRVGATRGSFYWHFADREELLEAALATWERENTLELIPDAERISDPAQRLRRLFADVYDPPADAVELALAGAVGDPVIDRVVARVTRRRVDFLRRIFVELGHDDDVAAERAWLAYAFYFGHHRLATVPGLDAERPAGLQRVADLLTGPPPDRSAR